MEMNYSKMFKTPQFQQQPTIYDPQVQQQHQQPNMLFDPQDQQQQQQQNLQELSVQMTSSESEKVVGVVDVEAHSSTDDQRSKKKPKKRGYHRHTKYQVQQMEAYVVVTILMHLLFLDGIASKLIHTTTSS